MNIILLAPPGAGKGTQGHFLINDHKFIGIITGDLLRAESKSGSDLGNQIKALIDAGNFVPDEMINDMLTTHLSNLEIPEGCGLLFDGYPRTVEQAEYLDSLVTIDKVIFLNVNQEELVKRILKRGKTSKRADDQNEEVIRARIQTYIDVTHLIKDYYAEKVIEINAFRSIKDVYQDIVTNLNL